MNGNAEDAGVVCSTSEPWRRHIAKPTQDPSKCLDGPRALHANPVVLRFNAREHAAFFFLLTQRRAKSTKTGVTLTEAVLSLTP